LVFLGVFIDLRSDISAESGILVYKLIDVSKNLFVLVFALDRSHGLGVKSSSSNIAGFLDVADIELNSSVSERSHILFRVRNGDLVDFHSVLEDGSDDPLGFFFQVLVVEVAGLVFLYGFLFETGCFKLEHHFGQVFRDHSSGHSDFALENGSSVKSLLDM